MSVKVKEKGRDNKRKKATSHTNDGTESERRREKILPHSPLMLASSNPTGEDGLLPVTLRSESGE